MASEATQVITCPSCKAQVAVSASLAGQRGRCAGCGKVFTVPSLPPPEKPATTPPSPPKKAASDTPEYVGVECRVCGTRLHGRIEHVGKKIKCPDCGAGTVLPEPPKPKPKNMPAALDGEQYELWDVDEQPLPSQLIATQAKFIAMACRKCGTLMQAAEAQVGQQIACPDCGATHIVPAPTKPEPKRSVLASDSQTPQLDPAAAPGAVPPVNPRTSGLTLAEQQHEAELERAREESQRTGRPMKYDKRGRRVLPRFPLLTGILPFPFSPGCPTRWITLSIGLLISAALLLDGIPAWATWNGGSMGAMRAMGGLGETMLGGVGVIIWLAAVSSIVIAIITQSAVGDDRIDDWPALNFIHSMSEMLPLGIAIVFTAAPGWMLGKLVAPEIWQVALLAGGTLLLGLPLTLLAQMAGSSTWELVDLKVLGAAVRSPFSMLLTYLESACLLAICAGAIIALASVNYYLALLAAPLIVGCILLYARIVGRLGWRLSEKITVDDPTEDDERPPVTKDYRPPTRSPGPT